MKYKALILDLDGTTIANYSSDPPTPRVTEAIKKAHKRIHISIATGRPLYIVKHLIDHLELSGPCILNNGSQIYDPVKKKIIHEVIFDKAFIPKIYGFCKKKKLHVRMFDGIKDIVYNGEALPGKVLSLYIPNGSIKAIDALIDFCSILPQVATHRMVTLEEGFHSVEITHTDASKLHGIVEVMRHLNIQKEEIIGVGDSYNDYPLLMASGLKIAMGNAVPELKKIADFIAPSVEEDGVATVIEKFILHQ
ncbi:MAG: Cof-like protein hydrolase [Candidatus Gottesmanbacteria bacterium GW2011_GWA2_47_9]|uniref:Cof-like protein hydrolase n=2 Tax=Candidatus Gottesmaniibacteriota TaxID=1752720 RepID=A0A0G1UNI3_9BACT|nr:MAG: Cof-like protein hydrolase [Candidatus Gottesmanbacteria bacterium GW2011_GWA2_47_9]KKU95802.1 MAG: Cof-like protein hydrolase [Candidatus Gottesmanbacteria bacterium GW2011_GWA1_48_13]